MSTVEEPAAPPEPSGSLWRHRDFTLLWSGETLSQVGGQITELVLPLTAILLLHAQAGTVGLLATCFTAPVLGAVFVGTWVDRHRTRRVMTTVHLLRAGLICLVPLAYLAGWLNLGVLVFVALTVGSLTALFNVIYISYLPTLVTREQMVEANARLEATYSISQIGGPGLAGILIQVLMAPLALLVNAVTYATAALFSSRIRTRDARPEPATEAATTWQGIRDGVRLIMHDPVLRPLVLVSTAFNLFGGCVYVLLPLFGTRDLGLTPGLIGGVIAVGSVGGLTGVLLASRTARWWGAGRAMVWSMAFCAVALALVPAAGGSVPVAVAFLGAGLVLNGVGLSIFNVQSLAARALRIPHDRLGTVTGAFQTLSMGALPASGLLAAGLGSLAGVRTALVVCVVVLVLACVGFVFSRARRFTVDAEPAGEAAT